MHVTEKPNKYIHNLQIGREESLRQFYAQDFDRLIDDIDKRLQKLTSHGIRKVTFYLQKSLSGLFEEELDGYENCTSYDRVFIKWIASDGREQFLETMKRQLRVNITSSRKIPLEGGLQFTIDFDEDMKPDTQSWFKRLFKN